MTCFKKQFYTDYTVGARSITNFWWQNGVEAGIHATYDPICVVKPIGVDTKSETVPMTQD